jgi:hypothetical protein
MRRLSRSVKICSIGEDEQQFSPSPHRGARLSSQLASQPYFLSDLDILFGSHQSSNILSDLLVVAGGLVATTADRRGDLIDLETRPFITGTSVPTETPGSTGRTT